MSIPITFSSLLDTPPIETRARRWLNRRAVLVPFAVVVVLLTLWAALAPLSGAVIASARIKVELERKTVQHREGGIVREIRVRNGQQVRAGEILVVLDDVRGDSELSLLEDQMLAERVRNARVSAETTLARSFSVDAALSSDPRAGEHLARERAQFAARRRTLDEQIVALQAQVREANSQAAALGSQIESLETSGRLAAEELKLNEKLVTEGYVPRARLLPLQRADSDYHGRVGESRGQLALARQRTAELAARMAEARNRYQQAATDELKQSSARLREIEERLRPSKDQVDRQAIRSPVDGVVMGLRISAAGEVLAAGAAVLDVVPSNELLVVEARIRPQDINHVFADARAQVRLTAFDARTTPLLPGRVTFVSPDRERDPQTGESWFSATVEVDPSSLRHHPEIHLRAGMPAELFVTTSARSVFEYLVSPITAFTNRAMRET
ncbi:MAG TPA: HlyD family type I secretion periplasmic adaptor subunit [Steroidobacteraceae bacterium]|jgi:HlyD family type I secretion membrane fusion protein|nr:HlyD family type I secretion periplasmic adaptor subunit [Steroidobacteraceae bacterium]